MSTAEESSISELFGELRLSLERVHGRDLSITSGASRYPAEQWLESCLGHKPHPDIVDWFAFEPFDSELVPWVRLEDMDRSKETYDRYAAGLEDSFELLALDTDGRFDFFPLAVGGSGEAFVCTPTRLGADRPRMAAIDSGEVFFEYVGLNPYISSHAEQHSELPTLREWLRAAVDAADDGRFSPSFQGFPGLVPPDVDESFDSPTYDAGSVVSSYPWPRQVMPPEE